MISEDPSRVSRESNFGVRLFHLTVETAPIPKLKSFFGRLQHPPRRILSNVSAEFPAGHLTAIIGSSGSGKTTLLQLITGRDQGGRLLKTGHVLVGDKHAYIDRNRTAYVPQSDHLIPHLTVRETLYYAAGLRLPAWATAADRSNVVNQLIGDFELDSCKDTRIGDASHKGCSGGEIRRVAVACQMIARQPFVVLDEPTTGLDAASALHVVRILHKYARQGRTVVMTIHQPRAEIWQLIDDVVILSDGQCAYSGSVDQCLPYFAACEMPKPPHMNPFEFLVDTTTIDTRSPDSECSSRDRLTLLQEQNSRRVARLGSMEGAPYLHTEAALPNEGEPISHVRSFQTLVSRESRIALRSRLGTFSCLVEALVMGFMGSWIFGNPGQDEAGVRSREGAIFMAVSTQAYLVAMFETWRACTDMQIFDREREDGIVNAIEFIVCRRCARFLLEDVPMTIIFSLSFYFIIGFERSGRQFSIFFSVMLMLQIIGANVAACAVAISRNFTIAALIANVVSVLQLVTNGFMANIHEMAVWIRWIRYSSWVYYAYGALSTNEFAQYTGVCPSSDKCLHPTGSQILTALELSSDWLLTPILLLLALLITTLVLSIILLHFSQRVIKSVGITTGETRQEAVGCAVKVTCKPIPVAIDSLTLQVTRKSPLRRSKTSTVVQDVSCEFQSGSLNVILGPSGSGKTSLLNALAGRSYNTATSKWSSSGEFLFQGRALSTAERRDSVSYVSQADHALLPYLTVRESLHIAAEMRMQQGMSIQQKVAYAEDLLVRLGLASCADTLIGDEWFKGISGGEKRRVVIAIQLLTDPNVLILDEPTSSLDAFTAASIMELLASLSREGRTVILSIHQPRASLFDYFGQVLILAKGRVTFSGRAAELLDRFAAAGHHCPENSNPADFAIDVVAKADRSSQLCTLQSSLSPVPVDLKGSKFVSVKIRDTGALNEFATTRRTRLSFRNAVAIQLKRISLQLCRNYDISLGRLAQPLGLGIILSLFFAPLKNDFYSIGTRMGFIYVASSLYFVGMLNAIAVFPIEYEVFCREEDDNILNLESFFTYFTMVEVPLEIVGSFFFAILADLVAGLPRTPSMFFLVAFYAFSIMSCGESLGIMLISLFSASLAVPIACIVLSAAMSMAGVLSLSTPKILQALNCVSPVKWLIRGLSSYSLHGQHFSCEPWQLVDDRCPIQTGDEVLNLYKMNVRTAECASIMAGIVVGYRLLAYAILKMKRLRRSRVEKRKDYGVSNLDDAEKLEV